MFTKTDYFVNIWISQKNAGISFWLVSDRFAFACIVYQRIRAREQFNFVPSSTVSWSPKREIRLNASALFICCVVYCDFFPFVNLPLRIFEACAFTFVSLWPLATSNMRKRIRKRRRCVFARDDLNGRSTVIFLPVHSDPKACTCKHRVHRHPKNTRGKTKTKKNTPNAPETQRSMPSYNWLSRRGGGWN